MKLSERINFHSKEISQSLTRAEWVALRQQVEELEEKAANWDMLARLPRFLMVVHTLEGKWYVDNKLTVADTPAEALRKYWKEKEGK